MTGRAAQRWADALAAWAIPDEIMAQAPESPWFHPPALFAAAAEHTAPAPTTPTHEHVAEATAAGGTVLDVGVGGGAASLPASPPARRIVGVDQSRGMLDEFTRIASARGIETETVEGRWPDVADTVPRADVVVCAHVAYNVADLDAFVRALTDHATRRVVLELTAVHPQSAVSWLWKHFWDVDRPTTPTADDAAAVVAETVGTEPEQARWTRAHPMTGHDDPDRIPWLRRRLCLTADRDDELARVVADHEALEGDTPVEIVTLWWPGTSPANSTQ